MGGSFLGGSTGSWQQWRWRLPDGSHRRRVCPLYPLLHQHQGTQLLSPISQSKTAKTPRGGRGLKPRDRQGHRHAGTHTCIHMCVYLHTCVCMLRVSVSMYTPVHTHRHTYPVLRDNSYLLQKFPGHLPQGRHLTPCSCPLAASIPATASWIPPHFSVKVINKVQGWGAQKLHARQFSLVQAKKLLGRHSCSKEPLPTLR